jgi:release factor glutamine methyltransferase
MEKAEVDALDVSREAAELAKENARINKSPINVFQANILDDDQLPGQYGLIVSNPPYVRESEKKFMHKNILEHEPHQALFVDDKNPLFFYRKILKFAQNHLSRNGWIYFEINEAMGQEMVRLLDKKGYLNIRLKKDINGKNRMIKAQKP